MKSTESVLLILPSFPIRSVSLELLVYGTLTAKKFPRDKICDKSSDQINFDEILLLTKFFVFLKLP